MVARPTLHPRWLDVAGHRLHVRAATSTPASRTPVVLVHGWGVSSRYMVPVARRLAAARHVYAPDLPGHGRSAHPRCALDITGLADALLAVMDAVALERPVLLGNSMGCQVACSLAARHPERVERLVLVGPTLDDAARTMVRHSLRLVADIPFERPSLIPVVAWDYLRMGPRLLWQELRHMIEDRELEAMRAVRAPALVVRGERDAVVPRAWAATVAAALRAGPVREVPRWGHALNFSAPDELAAIVEPFLDATGR